VLHAYRIEHRETRVGPFQTEDPFTQQLARAADQNPALPHPDNDNLRFGLLPFRFVFGCADLDTLRAWFLPHDSEEANREILSQLQQRGFVLSEYLADEGDYRVARSGMQVVFDAAQCRRDGLAEDHDIFTMLEPQGAVA
jgi:hypothetical protein